jgi:hypothetical protein
MERPERANVMGSKWVFRAKKNAAGKIYKVRLVPQGFLQIPGVDYFDMFAPVARLTSIQTILAFAASKDLETGQIDIKGAYLNGELTDNKSIYMCQPPGYAQGSLVCKVHKRCMVLSSLVVAGIRSWWRSYQH